MTKEEVIDYAVKNIQGWTSPADLDVLWDLVMENVPEYGLAIEIGAWKGESTYVMGYACMEKKALLYAIDTFAGIENPWALKNKPEALGSYYEAVTNPDFHEICLENVRELPVAILKGDSQLIHNFLPDKMFDFCFIDGNHQSPVVDNDIRNYLRKIKPGGILCGHDFGNPETDVTGAVNKILGKDIRIAAIPGIATSIWIYRVKGENDKKTN